MVIDIHHADFEAEIVVVEKPLGHEVVAGFGNVRVDGVVGGG